MEESNSEWWLKSAGVTIIISSHLLAYGTCLFEHMISTKFSIAEEVFTREELNRDKCY